MPLFWRFAMIYSMEYSIITQTFRIFPLYLYTLASTVKRLIMQNNLTLEPKVNCMTAGVDHIKMMALS